MDKEKADNNLQIFCRIRAPKVASEAVTSVKRIDDTRMSVSARGSVIEEVFEFEHVFGAHTQQEDVFERMGRPLVESVLVENRNALLFSYGVTGSGKSHTINGSLKHPGLIPKVINHLFGLLENNNLLSKLVTIVPDGRNHYKASKKGDPSKVGNEMRGKQLMDSIKSSDRFRLLVSKWQQRLQHNLSSKPINTSRGFSIFITFVEVYNKCIYDLLAKVDSSAGIGKRIPKKMRQDPRTGEQYVMDIKEVRVDNAEEAMQVFLIGLEARKTGSTNLNDQSSRSHAIFTIKVVHFDEARNPNTCSDRLKVHHISIVDLAGQERNARTKNAGNQLLESNCINLSLFTLRKCFEAIRQSQSLGRPQPIPYREDTLTRLFQHFFEKGSLIRMIICVNPVAQDVDENRQVMCFAQRANEIVLEEGDSDDEEPDNDDNEINEGGESQQLETTTTDNNKTPTTGTDSEDASKRHVSFSFNDSFQHNQRRVVRLSVSRFKFKKSRDEQHLIDNVGHFLEVTEANDEKIFHYFHRFIAKLDNQLEKITVRQHADYTMPSPYTNNLTGLASQLATGDKNNQIQFALLEELGRELEKVEEYSIDEHRRGMSMLQEVLRRYFMLTPGQTKLIVGTGSTLARLYNASTTMPKKIVNRLRPLEKSRDKVSKMIKLFESKYREQVLNSLQIGRCKPMKRAQGEQTVSSISNKFGRQIQVNQKKTYQTQGKYNKIKAKVDTFRRK